MSETPPHMQRLIDAGPRVPSYLSGLIRALDDKSDALVSFVSAFVKSPVTLETKKFGRRVTVAPTDENQLAFELGDLNGTPIFRVLIKPEDAAMLTESVFGGEVDEPMVQKGVAKAFARRLIAVISDESEEDIPPFLARKPLPLSDEPAIVGNFAFALAEDKLITCTVECSRAWSDKKFPPTPSLTYDDMDKVKVSAVAALGQAIVCVKDMIQWRAGTELSLPSAKLEDITVTAKSTNGHLNLLSGEMGTDTKGRCLRLKTVTIPKPSAKAPAKSRLQAFG